VPLGQPAKLVQRGIHRSTHRVDGVHLADRPIPNPFAEGPNRIRRMALVAKLGHHLVLARRLHHLAHLVNRMGQRLLAIHVFAPLHRRDGRHRVGVIGCRHHHGVNLRLHLIQHPPEIPVSPGLGILRKGFASPGQVHVTQGDEIALARHRLKVPPAHAPNPNPRDIQALTGGRPAAGRHHVTRNDHDARGRGSGQAQEAAAVQGEGNTLCVEHEATLRRAAAQSKQNPAPGGWPRGGSRNGKICS